jgi:predicted dithiol-disulfide oxidoreductase (DUF899 family)
MTDTAQTTARLTDGTIHDVASPEAWSAKRLALLQREKELNRLRDDLARQRRGLPWVRVEKAYTFQDAAGPVALADLFDGRSQLLVYHFMFGPDWTEGCPSCSFWADNFNGVTVHLRHRDVAFVAISRAPYEQLDRYRRRMGWTFRWISSCGSDFNRDFGVSFDDDQRQRGAEYNYAPQASPPDEAPGMSAFVIDADGTVFHTYSTYSRGLDPMNGCYQMLDLVAKGRDEDALPWTMAWLRRHDSYPSSD